MHHHADSRRLAYGRTPGIILLIVTTVLLLSSCGSPGTTPPPRVDPLLPDPPPENPITNVTEQLTALDIDVAALEASPRSLNGAHDITGEYSPLGSRARISPKEILATGVLVECLDWTQTELISFPLLDHESGTMRSNHHCYLGHNAGDQINPLTAQTPDGTFDRPGTQSSRTITAGNLVGFGDLQHGILLNARRAINNPEFMVLEVQRILENQGEHGLLNRVNLIAPFSLGIVSVLDLAAVMTDLNGDSTDDLLIAVIVQDDADPSLRSLQLHVLLALPVGGFQFGMETPVFTHEIPAGHGSPSVRLVAGNIDLDPQAEFALLLRNMQDTGADDPEASVSYFVFDSLGAGVTPELLYSGTAGLPGGADFLTADVAIGDFDGDGLGELALTGILAFPEARDPCGAYTFGYVVFDDRVNAAGSLTELDSFQETVVPGTCHGAKGFVYEVFAAAVDYDGGYSHELLANDRMMRVEDGKLVVVGPVNDFYEATLGGHLSEATFSLTVGDFNNDGLEDIALYDNLTKTMRLQGLELTHEIPLNVASVSAPYPVILAYDNDNDGMVVEYQPGSHRVILTEPVVLAVLAAPPYSPEFGQQPLSASTSYGQGSVAGQTNETSVSVTSSATVGLGVGFGLGKLEVSSTVSASFGRTMERAQGTAYETTYTNTYTTQGTDSVVYTSLPYDAYDYTVIASVDTALIGSSITVMLPREPVTRVANLGYFNDRVPPGSMVIDDSVLTHTPGDPTSYMNHAGMIAIRDEVQERTSFPDLFLQTTAANVGQGSTITTRTIGLSTSNFHSNAVGYTMDHTVELTVGGAFSGFSIGSGSGSSVTYEAGESMEVSASVPGVTTSEATHPGSNYRFGMFTYMHRYGGVDATDGQLFQVVNFWVE